MCSKVTMGGEKIVVRSYRRQQQKKLAFAAIICMIIMALNFTAVFKPYFRRPPIHCDIFNYSNSRSDVYELNGDVRIHGASSTIFIPPSNHHPTSITVKPHPRKYDAAAMTTVTAFQIKAADKLPRCTQTLAAPAILFSTGAHAGNHFHGIADVLVPLYATSHRFNRHVIFLVTNHDSRVTSKHTKTLQRLSKYDVVDIDAQNQTLCFPGMIVGLRAHTTDLSIDPSPFSTFSARNFTKLLRSAYSLERESARGHHRPRMLIISRSRSRRLTNELEVVELARSLGFECVAQDLRGEVESVAKIVNSVDVMVGVHGAGLTNMVFLPENAVVIQITPVGLHNFARQCYGSAEEEMKLKYLEYKVRLNESSLLGKYPAHTQVYTNPVQFCHKRGFEVCKHVFLDNQDVNLDLGRFRDTLFKALDLLALVLAA